MFSIGIYIGSAVIFLASVWFLLSAYRIKDRYAVSFIKQSKTCEGLVEIVAKFIDTHGTEEEKEVLRQWLKDQVSK